MGSEPVKCAPLCVMLTVKDTMKTIAFYRDVLGLRPDEHAEEEERRQIAEAIRRHGRDGGFPVGSVTEVAAMIGPSTARGA